MIRKILTYTLLSLTAFSGFFTDTSLFSSGEYTTGTNLYAAEIGDTVMKVATPVNSGLQTAAEIGNTVTQIISIIATPAIILASWLLSPDWTAGDLFGLREVMYNLWVTISNIIYFVYAILLIIIALGTIFGNEKFSYKVMLPRLALGILMVPFTWWFVQVTIAVSTFLTASVVSIPYDILTQMNKAEPLVKIQLPKTIEVKAVDPENISMVDCSQEGACITLEEMYRKGGGVYGNLLIYAYGVFKFDKIKEIQSGWDVIRNTGQLVNQLVIGSLMFIVFGILVLALIFMLMVRVIKLWVYTIFSPLFTLHFVAGKDLLGDTIDDFNLKEFIGLCFVPAAVGLALSFGLVVIASVMQPLSPGKTCDPNSKQCELPLFGTSGNKIVTTISPDPKDQNSEITQTTYTIFGIDFKFEGEAHPKGTGMNGAGVASSLLGIAGTIIIDIIALIFIWVAFMAAKNMSKAVGKAVEPFEAMGKKIGELGASAPKYIPIPGLGLSAKGLDKAVEMGKYEFEYGREKKQKERIQQLFGFGVESFSADENRARRTTLQSVNGNEQSMRGYLAKIAEQGNRNNSINQKELASEFADFMSKSGKTEIEVKSYLIRQGISDTDAGKMAKWLKEGNSLDETKRTEAWNLFISNRDKLGTPATETPETQNTTNTRTGNTNSSTNQPFNFAGISINNNSTAESVAEAIKNQNTNRDFSLLSESMIKDILPEGKKELAARIIEILQK